MSTIKVNKLEQRSGCTATVGGGAGKTVVVDATTVTLGRCGGTVSLASGASQSGFGRTGTVDWDTTPKTTTFTAVSGDGFFCNTTSGGFTANLPAGTAGAIVSFADYAGTWQTGNLTVSPNGSDKIGGTNADVVLNTEGQSVTFVFADSTQGWINVQDSTSNERGNAFISATGGSITESGNCKIHTFTGPGTFTVSCAAVCAANNLVSYLVVAGGGGTEGDYSGGGGAGGYREVKSPVTPYTASPLDGYPSSPNRVTVTATSFPITVGAGGAGSCNPPDRTGNPGSVSTFSTITSAGGGGAGVQNPSTTPNNSYGRPGGSGGGGAAPSGPGGTGNTPPTTPAQGNNGGSGIHSGAYSTSDGGGGGAGAAGTNGSPGSPGGAGGAGVTSSINGTPTARAGGGGGAGEAGGGAAGSGGGGAGGVNRGSPPIPPSPATAGTVNTGGGGGGAANTTGVSGGSGIVIIRYKFQ
jgi:hypothetical protein